MTYSVVGFLDVFGLYDCLDTVDTGPAQADVARSLTLAKGRTRVLPDMQRSWEAIGLLQDNVQDKL